MLLQVRAYNVGTQFNKNMCTFRKPHKVTAWKLNFVYWSQGMKTLISYDNLKKVVVVSHWFVSPPFIFPLWLSSDSSVSFFSTSTPITNSHSKTFIIEPKYFFNYKTFPFQIWACEQVFLGKLWETLLLKKV